MLTFGSLFAGIGGLGAVVAASRIKRDQSFTHELNCKFLKLVVPCGMKLSCAAGKVVFGVVVLVEVYMVNAFAFCQRVAPCCRGNLDVLCNVSAPACVGVGWIKNVVVSVAEFRSLAALLFGFGNKHSPSPPRRVGNTLLISFRCNTRYHPQFAHGCVNDLLCRAILNADLLLRKAKIKVVVC